MKLFQRIEVWILLILSLGTIIWVFTMDGGSGNPESITGTDPSTPAIVVHRTTLERDHGNARLDVELRFRNASPRSLTLQPPDVRLLTVDGKEIPLFTLATERPAQIPPQTAQDIRLRYWLEKSHLQGSLLLDIRGQKVEIKTAAPLDLEKLENRAPKVWQGVIQ